VATLKTGENRHYPWSADNSVEIERGWLRRADTLGELAGLLGIPADALADTVAEFNTSADTGSPDSTGRTPDRIRPITVPPFYGAPVYPTLVNTQGGPRRDPTAAILRPDGAAIQGLFGAGELGSIWNRLYPGAGNVCECLVYGRIAGASAAAAVVSARNSEPEGVR
jgi:succinate dehydrogenase/fumarate reductase flavoprotein subunit